MEILEHKTINFDNVIKYLESRKELYKLNIQLMEFVIKTVICNSENLLIIENHKKLLTEYESAIDCLKAISGNVTYTITKRNVNCAGVNISHGCGIG